MKAFMQRWYVINQLYHYTYQRGDEFEFTEIEDFVRWCVGEDLKSTAPHWYNYLPPKGKLKMLFHRIMASLFMGNPTARSEYADALKGYRESKEKELIKWIIEECVNPHYALVMKQGDKLRLAPKGREEYPISYLWLRNSYAKKVWTGIIIAIAGAYVAYRLDKVIPKEPIPVNVQVEIKEKVITTSSLDIKG